MTNLEISKALALAIGWTENRRDENGYLDADIAIFGSGLDLYYTPDEVKVWDSENWRTFDFTSPLVIWPIAVKYHCFPIKNGLNHWSSDSWASEYLTPELAVAMYVIESAS